MSLLRRTDDPRLNAEGITHTVGGRGVLIGVGVLVAAFAVIVVLFVAIVALAGSGGGDEVDCERFAVRPGDWQAAAYERRRELVRGMRDCATLDGRPVAEAERLLGPPDARVDGALRYAMPMTDSSRTGWLQVDVEGDRVTGLWLPDDLGGGRTP